MKVARILRGAALAVIAVSGPTFAQTDAPTRAAAARAAREAKAAVPSVHKSGRVERVLTMLEIDPTIQQVLGRRDGFAARIGGIEDGAGLAIGPAWRTSTPFNGNLRMYASAAASPADREVEGGLSMPHLRTRRLAFAVDGASATLSQERFFGAGVQSRRIDQTTFGLARRHVRAAATITGADWLRLSGAAGVLSTSAIDGRAPRLPGITTLFTSGDAPGIGSSATFTMLSLAATVDYRDVALNPRRGGRYHVAVHRYAGSSADRHSFTRVDVEVEQHLAAWKRQRLLTVRGIASMSAADAGHDVPFYLQRTLGGSRLLRGFVTDRFRDRNLVALQAEYGWDVLPFLSGVLFLEGGTVAPEWRDLRVGSFRRDYGIGFRLGSARTVALRTDVALGSGEGTRVTMRFSHAF